uniref:C-type lectin domain-containing protein n=1 Tax=Caenorhabditis japonica TaxID=281687 RepID=A0A8R1I0U1_CAEJA
METQRREKSRNSFLGAFDNHLKTAEESNECWIGLQLSATGSWKWADGSLLNYTNWSPNQPVPGQACAQMITDHFLNTYNLGKWESYECSSTSASYICQRAASMQ